MSRLLTSVLLLAAFVAAPVTAQTVAPSEVKAEATKAEATKAVVSKVALEEDGQLKGKVFANVEGEKTPTKAKLTLSAEGVVVDVVEADEEGNFAFANIAPGTYQMYGYSDGYVGGGAVDVMPYASSGCSSCNVGLDAYSSDVAYDSYASAPAQSFGSCGGCGCGGGFGGGGGIGGGGLLKRPLLLTGAALGIVGIAGGFDGDDDASPNN